MKNSTAGIPLGLSMGLTSSQLLNDDELVKKSSTQVTLEVSSSTPVCPPTIISPKPGPSQNVPTVVEE
ncbi:hypothetical protein ACTXT7_001179 [Hymenolepis weldensis]